jgi:hypothetical protein
VAPARSSTAPLAGSAGTGVGGGRTLDAERHAQVGGQTFDALGVPHVVVDDDVPQGAHGARELDVERRRHLPGAGHVGPGGGVLAQPAGDGGADVGRGDELATDRLGQRPDGGDAQLVEQAGHHAVEPGGGDAVEDRHGDVHGDAVGVGAGGELVGERQGDLALRPRLGERGGVDGVGVDELCEREGEQVGVVPLRGLPPGVEVAGADDVGGDPLVVEGEQVVLGGDEAALPGPRLELLGLGEQPPVLGEELVVGRPLALDERVPHEHLAGGLGVDLGEQHGPVGDDGHAVEQHLLRRHGGALSGGPVRVGVGALREVAGERLGPLGLDLRDVARPQPGRLDELARHDPLGRLLAQRRPGEDREPGTARTQVLVAGTLRGLS